MVCHGIQKKMMFESSSVVSSFDFSVDQCISKRVPSTGLNLKEIILIEDEFTKHTLEVFVRFASVEDYDLALKHNWHLMGIRLD